MLKRHCAKGETHIRNGPEVCQSIAGFDAANLYGACLRDQIPVGPYILRYADNNFVAQKRERFMSAYFWMDFLVQQAGGELDDLQHYLNSGKEVYVAGLPVDGFSRTNN